MAILNNTTLNNLRTTIRGEFNVAFKNANAGSMYKHLATTIQSSSKTNTYDWLGKFPQMREWVGSRVLKDMSESSYQIANKKYEAPTSMTTISGFTQQSRRAWDRRLTTSSTARLRSF